MAITFGCIESKKVEKETPFGDESEGVSGSSWGSFRIAEVIPDFIAERMGGKQWKYTVYCIAKKDERISQIVLKSD